jgi:hypothetical protein
MPITLFNTGIGLKEGDPDPHWQLVARSDDRNFKPRPAVVSRIPSDWWLANDPARSQWISIADGPPDVPRVIFTFRTTFDLVGALPETAVLRGGFIADNHVDAIRLNGKAVRVCEHREEGLFHDFHGLFVEKGFSHGINTLEIDVRNGCAGDGGQGTFNPMGLRIELSGSVLAGYPRNQDLPGGKEGAAIN